jgi:hypothetical protein
MSCAANNPTSQKQTRWDCLKAANKKFINASKGPGAWQSFKKALQINPIHLSITTGFSCLMSPELACLLPAYPIEVVANGVDQMIDYSHQASAASQQYDLDVSQCPKE